MTLGGTQHVPVMLAEVLELLDVRGGDTVVDATLGGGGHCRRLAECVGASGLVIAVDRDPDAVERFAASRPPTHIRTVAADFRDLPEVLQREGVSDVNAILLDLGLSSDQLADPERGFSFHADGPLDLRFDPGRGEPAWKLLARLSAEHLADLIYKYGEEKRSRRIARAIVARRTTTPIRTASELAAVVRSCVPRRRRERIDPATRTFQALRIAVNEELKALEIALRRAPALLCPGGRLAIISFHSLEDRLVKESFRSDNRLEVITRRPVRPTEAEVLSNPRARSARLRVARRTDELSGGRK